MRGDPADLPLECEREGRSYGTREKMQGNGDFRDFRESRFSVVSTQTGIPSFHRWMPASAGMTEMQRQRPISSAQFHADS
jgi:hypothetical protein